MSYKNNKISYNNCVIFKCNIELTQKEYFDLLKGFRCINMDDGKWDVFSENNTVTIERSWSRVEFYKFDLIEKQHKYYISEIKLNPEYTNTTDFDIKGFKKTAFQILNNLKTQNERL